MMEFDEVFDAMPDAIIIVDSKGSIVHANSQTEALFGYRRDELTGKPVEILVPLYFRAKHPILRDDYLEKPAVRPMASGLCLYGCHKDGQDIDVEIGLSPLHTPAGLFVIACLRDIRERKKLEMQLLQAQKLEAIGRLAAGIAHDFNNVLTVILGSSNLLLEQTDLNAAHRTKIKMIHQAADRAAALTRQLLQFSRQQIVQPRIIDLNSLVTETCEMMSKLVGESIAIKLNLDSKISNIKVDPGQVQQVIINLVVNARDAMPNGGTIQLETQNIVLDEQYCTSHKEVPPGHYVKLVVTDTGCGMDADTQSRVFEPFFTTKGLGKGTGLGLATVFGIVKQAGGHISIYSELGKGTSFKIHFPASAEEESAPHPSEARSTQYGAETILLVEDEEEIRGLLAEILTSKGYTVLSAKNGSDAMKVYRKARGKIQLLLTDVIMPDMTGRDLSKELLRIQPDLKLIYMSGYTSNVIANHGILDPGVVLLEKPISASALLDIVHEILNT